MAKGTIKLANGVTLILDDFLRELSAGAVKMPRMLELVPIAGLKPA